MFVESAESQGNENETHRCNICVMASFPFCQTVPCAAQVPSSLIWVYLRVRFLGYPEGI